jgi:hypothetical protein
MHIIKSLIIWYSSQNIIMVIKLRKIKLASDVARMGMMNTSYNIVTCRPISK